APASARLRPIVWWKESSQSGKGRSSSWDELGNAGQASAPQGRRKGARWKGADPRSGLLQSPNDSDVHVDRRGGDGIRETSANAAGEQDVRRFGARGVVAPSIRPRPNILAVDDHAEQAGIRRGVGQGELARVAGKYRSLSQVRGQLVAGVGLVVLLGALAGGSHARIVRAQARPVFAIWAKQGHHASVHRDVQA